MYRVSDSKWDTQPIWSDSDCDTQKYRMGWDVGDGGGGTEQNCGLY